MSVAIFKKLCLVVVFAVLFMACYPVNLVDAAAKITWTTTNVYYEETPGSENPPNVIVIEGYMHNHTDKYLNWFYEVNFLVDVASFDGDIKINGNFNSVNLYIEPRSSTFHRFRVTNSEYRNANSYNVKLGYCRWKQSSSAG